MVLIGNGPSKPNPKPSMSGSVLRPVRSLRRPLGNTASSSRFCFDWSDYRGPRFRPWPKRPNPLTIPPPIDSLSHHTELGPRKKYAALGCHPAPQNYTKTVNAVSVRCTGLYNVSL